MSVKTIEVKGMSCGHCVQAVTEALSGVPGVVSVKVDLLAGTATFNEAGTVPEAQVRAAIERAGFVAGSYK